jgi:hydrogenase maturation protease
VASTTHSNRPPESILVAGLGNVLMGDDGAGPWVIRLIEAGFEFPKSVTVLDLGTPGLNITSFVSGYDLIIFIDTVHGSGPPGTVLTFGREDLLNATPQARIGPHDPGVHEALWSLELAGSGPADVALVGVIPEQCEMGASLSTAVRDALPSLVGAVLERLRAAGLKWTAREGGNASELWWSINGNK